MGTRIKPKTRYGTRRNWLASAQTAYLHAPRIGGVDSGAGRHLVRAARYRVWKMSRRKIDVQGDDATLGSSVSGQRGGSLKVKPPDISRPFHVRTQSTKYPQPCAPNPSCMIEASSEAPCPRPGPCLEIEVGQVIQDHILLPCHASYACHSTHYKKLVFMNDGSMPRSTSRDRPTNFGKCPGEGIEIKNDDVGEIFAMFIFASKHNQFIPLIQCRRVTYRKFKFLVRVFIIQHGRMRRESRYPYELRGCRRSCQRAPSAKSPSPV